MRFPAILKELRERNKISQAALARQVGISQSLIAQFETGEKVPNAYVLLRIATYFHTTCEELIGEVEEEQTTSMPFLPQETFLLALKNKKPPKSGGFLLLVRFAAFPAGCITVVMQARLSGDNTRP